MTNNTFGVILLVWAVIAIVGALIWSWWRQKQREKAYPLTWVHIGTPPPGTDVALDIIGRNTPGMPKAGYIEWVTAPFQLVGWNGQTILAAGTVDEYRPIRVRVLFDPKIERTALAHELGHVWDYYVDQGFGESPQDKRFVAWFTGVNRQIAEALGR